MYEFNVNNTAFIGKRIAFGDTNGDTISNPKRAQEIVNRYPQDKNVTVYYMPNNPKECLLEVGVKGHLFVSTGIGLFFFTVGIFVGSISTKGMIMIKNIGNEMMRQDWTQLWFTTSHREWTMELLLRKEKVVCMQCRFFLFLDAVRGQVSHPLLVCQVHKNILINRIGQFLYSFQLSSIHSL
jgi:hypothetical protein